MRYLYSKKLVPVSETVISKVLFQIEAQLYIDNTDLPMMNQGNDSAKQLVTRAQIILNYWHNTLWFTGGDLKLKKSY